MRYCVRQNQKLNVCFRVKTPEMLNTVFDKKKKNIFFVQSLRIDCLLKRMFQTVRAYLTRGDGHICLPTAVQFTLTIYIYRILDGEKIFVFQYYMRTCVLRISSPKIGSEYASGTRINMLDKSSTCIICRNTMLWSRIRRNLI